MNTKTLAMVTNYHQERRIGRKTANFIGAVYAHLQQRGIQLNVEFVLDRPDAITQQQIEMAVRSINDARIHIVDFGNLGMSRTHGVHSARGDVVCFVDGDDFFSMNWFEGALDYLSSGRRSEVLHTQYMVGFDNDTFIRETMESDHPAFDPLSLAVDWYWSANLAVQADVFAAMPIQPYDHARGFGSEDWHWACNCLAAGIGRVSLPNTSYYYRVKPERFSLGRVADVIHMASPLFTRRGLPPPPSTPSNDPIPVSDLSPEFFEQAREIEAFEVGLSYLRAVEAGGWTVRHFKPHTPPIVGEVWRAILAAGFRDGSVVVFGDMERLAGGLPMAEAMTTALTGAPRAPRLYIVDGNGPKRHARADGYVLAVGELRAAGLYNEQIDRLVARLMIQFGDLTVINLLSSRVESSALAYSRAARGGVSLWINVVMEYGFDALSQAFHELDRFVEAGVESENIGVFRKTVTEVGRMRGVELLYYEDLEADYVDGVLGSRLIARAVHRAPIATLSGAASPAESRVFRLTPEHLVDVGEGTSGDVALAVTESLRTLSETEEECIFASGEAFLGLDFGDANRPRPPGLRIPALTIIEEDGQQTLYVRHPPEDFESEIRAGRIPADIASVGAIGVDCASLREVIGRSADQFALSTLIAVSVRNAVKAGQPCVELFASNAIVSVKAADLGVIDKARFERSLASGPTRKLADV
jgi:hypothetical protein